MSKKQKRRVATPAGSPRETHLKSASTPPASRYTSNGDFNPDYSHVKKDLKRIGLLAVSFFAILIILSFFLR